MGRAGIDGLNEPQRRAVVHPGGPLLVFAGAGSGKTRVITHRIAHLVAEGAVAPWRILAVTFTNKAAQEMRERATRLLAGGGDALWLGTFHSLCARLLRKHADVIGIRRDFTIYDDGDQKAAITRVVRDLGLDERRHPPKQLAARINRAKQEAVGPEDLPLDDAVAGIVQRVYRAYEAMLARSSALDFGDLIYRTVVAMEADPALRSAITGAFDHVLVDEFQDTNHVQYRLVRVLAATHRNLSVVGDDDQSIYRWRGADRRNILDFQREFPDATVVKLEQNYRSTQRILRVAHSVISRNVDREPKTLWTENEQGPKVLAICCSDERDEARMVLRAVVELTAGGLSYGDVAVLYRTHAQSRVIEEALRGANVPYKIIGGLRFYDRAEVKDVLAYLRILINPDDDVSLLRVINTPTRGIGKTTIDRVLDLAARHGQGVWQALRGDDVGAAVGAAAARRLAAFVELISGLQALLHEGRSIDEIATELVDRIGYLEALRAEDSPEADARMQNVAELLGSIADFCHETDDSSMAHFLEAVTLQSQVDDLDAADRLTLMTIHAAKGLEFPAVMVTGMEDGGFPFRGLDAQSDPDELEEERRLAYVAFTRAERHLLLSWATMRRLFGQTKVGTPSRFLLEMPAEDVEQLGLAPSIPSPSSRPGPGAGGAYPAGRNGADSEAAGTGWSAPQSSGGGWGGADGAGDGAGLARRPHGDDGAYIDYDEGSDVTSMALRAGARVRHSKFGVGRVRTVIDGVPPRVEVDFSAPAGVRRILLSHLEPG